MQRAYAAIPKDQIPTFSPSAVYKLLRKLRLISSDITFEIARSYVDSEVDHILSTIYYAPGGYQGAKALHSLANEKQSKYHIPLEAVKRFLKNQAVAAEHTNIASNLKDIYVHFNDPVPNHMHQLDTMVLPEDNESNNKSYKRVLYGKRLE